MEITEYLDVPNPTPEQLLWIEVIREALNDVLTRDKRFCQECHTCTKCVRNEAPCKLRHTRYACSLAWIKSHDFDETCCALGLDGAAWVRRILTRERDKGRTEVYEATH